MTPLLQMHDGEKPSSARLLQAHLARLSLLRYADGRAPKYRIALLAMAFLGLSTTEPASASGYIEQVTWVWKYKL